ncbi:MAG: metal-dependent hydrolase [Halobacteriales archaeon]|nr:metal-dependent hydrolase [Halobacteriales archaeon]
MPSIVIHALIPPLVLLATRRFAPRDVLLLLPFSLLPDLDFFIPPHRALVHSVFLPVAALVLWWRWRARQPHEADLALLAGFYLFSHSFMDLFAGGVTPFWPLSDATFYIDTSILIDTRTLQPYPTFNPGEQQGVPEVSPVFEFFNGDHAAILALTLVVAGIWAWRRSHRIHRTVVVSAPEERLGRQP